MIKKQTQVDRKQTQVDKNPKQLKALENYQLFFTKQSTFTMDII